MMNIEVPDSSPTDTAMPGVSTSFLALARTVSYLHRSEDRPPDICFSFEKTRYLEVGDLATLSNLIRKAAEWGSKIQIGCPENDKLFYTLASYGFTRLFKTLTKPSPWQSRISLVGAWDRPKKSTHSIKILPVYWIQSELFDIDPLFAFHQQEPRLAQPFIESVSSHLRAFNVLSEGFLTDFLDVIVRELAWNVVMHGDRRPDFYGCFCARVSPDRGSMYFSIVDLGMGISTSLSDSFQKRGPSASSASLYTTETTLDEKVAAYSLERNSTSRNFDEGDARVHTDRGLYLVSELARQKGSLIMQTGEAYLTLNNSDRSTRLRKSDIRLQGTAISGTIGFPKQRRNRTIQSSITSDTDAENAVRDLLALPFDYIAYNPSNVARDYSAALKVIDIDFLDPNPNYLIQALLQNPCKHAIITNARHWKRLIGHLDTIPPEMLPDLIVLSGGNSEFLLIERAKSGNLSENRIVPHPDLCAEFLFRVQTRMLESGFCTSPRIPGFWTGRILQQNGTCVQRFFSIYEHVIMTSPSAKNIDRWFSVFWTLLASVVDKSEHSTTTLVGFAASMRPILKQIPPTSPLRKRTFIVNSYETPGRVDIKDLIRLSEGDSVVLCTDVVSSGTLLTSMVKSCLAAKAKVSAIVCLVHSASGGEFRITWTHGSHTIPFVRGALLHAPTSSPDDQSPPDFWVDPVSAVPLGCHPNQSKVVQSFEEAVDVLSGMDAFRFGHFRRGLYHSSVQVCFRALLKNEARIEEAIAEKLRGAVASHGWNDFNPDLMIHAQGQSRIDLLDAEHEPDHNEVRLLISQTISYVFRGSSRGCPVIPVPRLFDPGGRVYVAPIPIEFNGRVSDVVIFDHVMSSGGTLRSLMNQALRSGAKRILVVPLVARCAPSELESWENLREVGNDDDSAKVKFSHIYYVPAVHHASSNCPQCRVLDRLKPDDSSEEWRRQACDSIGRELDIGREIGVLASRKQFGATWLGLQGLLELSDGSPIACTRLGSMIQRISGDNETAQAAFLALLIRENQLLEKSFVRRSRDFLMRPALSALANSLAGTDGAAFAFTVFRMLYVEHYIGFACEHIDIILAGGHKLLARVMHHIDSGDSIEAEQRADFASRFLNRVNQDRVELSLSIYKTLQEWVTASPKGWQSTRGLTSCFSMQAVQHDIIGVLDELLLVTNWNDSDFVGLKGKNLFETWRIKCSATFRRTILPLLPALDPLSQSLIDYLPDFRWGYFTSEVADGTKLLGDLETITNLLTNRLEVTSRRVRRQLSELAQRVLKSVFHGPDSLAHLLSTFEIPTSQVLANIVSRFNFAELNVVVNETIRDSDLLFVPPCLVDEFCRLAESNLVKHSPELRGGVINLHLSLDRGSELWVRIEVEFRTNHSGKIVESLMSKKLDLALSCFNGSFRPFHRSSRGFFGPSLTVLCLRSRSGENSNRR